MHLRNLALSYLFLSCTPSFAGQIEDATFHSAALNAPLPVNIYRPDGAPPENGWPVLYLLHGHDGDQNSWRDLGNIEKTLDTLIAAGAIRPLVVVMPGVKNSWYVDSAAVGGPGDYETALTGDLRHQMEKRCRCGKTAKDAPLPDFPWAVSVRCIWPMATRTSMAQWPACPAQSGRTCPPLI